MKSFFIFLNINIYLLVYSCPSFGQSSDKFSNHLQEFYSTSKGDPNVCAYSNTQTLEDKKVDALITDMLSRIGAKNRFFVMNCSDVSNCQATVYNGKPYILYNPVFLGNLKKLNFSSSDLPIVKNDWASLVILAHEIGHHINNHLINPPQEATLIDLELEADETAGFIISLLGGDQESADFVYQTCPENRTFEHPARNERIISFKKGFENASKQKKIGNNDIVFENKGLVPLRTISGKYTFANFGTNTRVFNEEFDEVRPFRFGFAAVKKNGLWTFINAKGNYIIKPRYEYVNNFSKDGYAQVGYKKDAITYSQSTILNAKGVEMLPIGEYGQLSEGLISFVGNNGKMGYMDINGQEIISPMFDQVHQFSEGMAAVWNKDKKLWGFIDKTGKLMIDYIFSDVESGFSEGLAAVYKNVSYKGECCGDLGGYIDKTGKTIIPFNYIDVNEHTEGYATVEDVETEEEVLIDRKGQVIKAENRYKTINTLSDGIYQVTVGENGLIKAKFGFIDQSFQEIIPPVYEYGTSIFSEGKCYVVKNGRGGIIDKKGNIVIGYKYESREIFPKFVNGIIKLSKKDHLGSLLDIYVDENGFEYIE